MKLSHTDLRPRRPARYVPLGPRRKIPLLRGALLIGCAVFLYTRFDSIWLRVRGLTHRIAGPAETAPASPALPAPANARLPVWNFNGDSSRAALNCGEISGEACCDALNGLGLCGEMQALIAKAQWNRGLGGKTLVSGVAARIPREPGSSEGPALTELQGKDGKGFFHYRRTPGNAVEPEKWCDAKRGCLRPANARLPLSGEVKTRFVGNKTVFTAAASAVFPAFDGRVASVDSIGPDSFRVTVYHGSELYTRYGALARPAAGLKPGSKADPGTPLGEAAPVDGEAAYAVEMGMEKAGTALEASLFFSPPTGAAHGP